MSGTPNVAEKRPLAPLVLARGRFELALIGVFAGLAGLAACAPEPRPSSLLLLRGDPLIPPLSTYVEAPDLAERLRTIDVETRDLGLTMTYEARGKLAGGAGVVVVRAYEGKDAVGRTTHAVRAATPRGVIMAAGPQTYPMSDAAALEATELLPALISDPKDPKTGAFQAATDINGDGDPDVALRSANRTIEIWRLGPLGASRYEIRSAVPPTVAVDINDDGKVDLAGARQNAWGDRIRADLSDFAVWDGRRYTNAAPGAKARHASIAAAAAAALQKLDASADAAGRLAKALDLAWHTILSGGSRKEALERLDKEPVPADLRDEFAAGRADVERLLSH